jgi:cytochrome c-type biogenesis protein CcmF
VLLGTVFPLIVEAINGDTITVGNPYFERMTMPIGFTLLFLMAVAPVLPWRKASPGVMSDRLVWPASIAAGCLVVSVLVGARGWAPLLAFTIGGFAGGAALRQVTLATRRQGWRGLVGRTNGGMIVHVGVVLIAVAFAASNAYVRQDEFVLSPGQSAELAGHEVTYVGTYETDYPNRVERRVEIQIDGGQVYEPGIAVYKATGQPIGIASVRSTAFDDVALSVEGFPGDSDEVILRVTVQPLIMWLWVGGLVMAIGTFAAVVPGNRRQPTMPVSSPVPDEHEGVTV